MANVDPILAAGLECLAACACELELCRAEPQSHADVERLGLACKEGVPLSAPYHRIPTGMAIKIKAFSDGKCEANGKKVTHWALCGDGKLWASGPLASPLEVFAGALFEFPELSINLPGRDLMLKHAFSNAIADGTNTNIVRPSDWNSAHEQFVTLTGNTAGVSSVSGTNIVLAGGPNVTLSAAQGASVATISFSGGAGAAGNTGYISAGTTHASLGTVSFANSNGVTFGVDGQTITATVKTDYLTTAMQSNRGSDFVQANAVFNGTNASGTIASNAISVSVAAQSTQPVAASAANGSAAFSTLSFSNANGISFSTAAGPAIVASHNGLTTARASNDAIGLNTAQSNVTWTVNSSGLSLDARGYAGTGFTGTNISGTIDSVGVRLSVAPGGGGADGYNILAAGTQTAATTGSVLFQNSNGITFGMSNSSVITASHNGLTTQSGQAFSADASSTFQTLSFQNSNGVSFSNNAGALRVTHDLQFTSATSAITSAALHTSVGGRIYVTAQSTGQSSSSSYDLRTLSIVPDGIISAGWSNGSFRISATQSNQAVSANNGSYAFQTLSFSNANGISFGTSAGSAITASHNALTTARASNDAIGLNTAQSNVTWTVNSSGLSLDARGYAGTGTTFNGANVSGSMTVNSNGVQLSLSAGAGGGVTPVASASNGSFSFTTLAFSNANNVTFGTSAGSIITASVAAPGAAAENNWIDLLGANTAGNTTASGSTIGYSGINITLSGTNDSRVVISAPATSSLVGTRGISLSSNGSTVSIMHAAESYYANFPAMYNTQTQSAAASTSVVFPFELRDLEQIAFLRMMNSVSMSSMASIATAANNTKTYSQQGTYNIVLYTRGIGASSLSLQSVASTSHSSGMSIAVGQNANGSQWTVTHAFSFPASAGTTSFSTSYATSLSNVNVSTTHLTAMSGIKFIAFPFSTTLDPNQYWMAYGFSTAATTNGNASLSNMRVTASHVGASQINLTYGEFGSANNASIQAQYALGSFSTAGGGTTASLGFSNISSSSSHVIPYITMARIA